MKKALKVIKIIYCIILWILMLIYIIYRKDSLMKNDTILVDNIVLGVFTIFSLMPIFTEIDILGIKIKREIEENKIEMQKELLEIRSDINASIQNSNIIYNYTNMPDTSLKDMEEKYSNNSKISEDINTDEESILCFKIRQKIEILLKQIAQKKEIYVMKYSTVNLLKVLNDIGIIPNRLYGVLIEIVIICNKSIHGAKISENHSKFIQNTYVMALKELEEINNKL